MEINKINPTTNISTPIRPLECLIKIVHVGHTYSYFGIAGFNGLSITSANFECKEAL
jgi:hypothetical protein